ncbi:MAG: methionine--tRNA ligase, partial [Micrococcaceae bacterium]|nr:methionine--tRNA ligase [Micrococcaceae bacterium]
EFTDADNQIMAAAGRLLEICRDAFSRQEFSKALEAIWTVLGDTNAYFAEQAPWVLRKTDIARMETVLYVTLEVLRRVGLLVQAVMPNASAALLGVLGQTEGTVREFESFDIRLAPGQHLPTPTPIFPKYEN